MPNVRSKIHSWRSWTTVCHVPCYDSLSSTSSWPQWFCFRWYVALKFCKCLNFNTYLLPFIWSTEGDFEETEEGEYILDDQAATEGNSKSYSAGSMLFQLQELIFSFFPNNFRSRRQWGSRRSRYGSWYGTVWWCRSWTLKKNFWFRFFLWSCVIICSR